MFVTTPRPRSGFTWTQLAISLAILGLLFVLLLPAQRNVGEAARRSQCRNNLKQIGLALHNYHDRYGTFPPPYTVDPSGRKLHSWRTLILPYLDQGPLYEKIDLTRPWNDPVNEPLRQAKVPTYQCPSAAAEPTHSTYLAVVASDGVFRWGETTSREQVTDGTADTLLVVDVNRARAIPWMEPTDLDERSLLDLATSSDSPHTGVVYMLMADGAARAYSQQELADLARALVSISGDNTPK
jgi:type II secretory pathway pseudopilin PulG